MTTYRLCLIKNINTNPTGEEAVNTDTIEQGESLSNEPNETGEIVDIDVPRSDEASSEEPSIMDSRSEGGIFGGNTSVLTLFLIWLVWAGRYRASRFA